MAIYSRLGVLLIALSGAPLLLVDGFRSPPGLWYATGGIVAGISLVVYTSISPFFRRTKPSSYPTPSPSTHSNSKAESTTDQTGPGQTAQSTESAPQKSDSTSGNDLEGTESLPSEESELPSATVKRPQPLPVTPQTIERTTSYTRTSGVKRRESRLTFRHKRSTPMVSEGRNRPSGTGNTYFKPVDSSHEFKFLQVDTKFSYVDIDIGPEFIGLDPIPDLIEVDIGPSAVSQEIVRSPVEIKISTLLKSLLAPTPRIRGATTTDDSTGTSASIEGYTHQRANDARPKRKQTIRDSRETQHGELDRFSNRTADPLTAFSGMNQSTEMRLQTANHEPGIHHRPTADMTGVCDWKNKAANGSEVHNDWPSVRRDPLIEKSIRTQDSEAIGELTPDVGLDYSPPRWEPPHWDADPFGVNDYDLGLAEESAFAPFEQTRNFRAFDWVPSVSIEGPAAESEFSEERFGLGGFAEPRQEMVSLPGWDPGNDSSPLFPDEEGFFLDEDLEEDWSLF